MTRSLFDIMDITELLRDGVKQYNIMTPKCFDSLIIGGELGDMDCLTAFISKVLT